MRDTVCPPVTATGGHTAPGFTVRNKIQDGDGDNDIRDIDSTKHYDDLSSGGDSGGPWFHLNNAYGIHVGEPTGDPDDAFYMAVSFISPGLGVTLLTTP